MNLDLVFLSWHYSSPLAWVITIFLVAAYFQDKGLADGDFSLSVPLFLQVTLKHVESEVPSGCYSVKQLTVANKVNRPAVVHVVQSSESFHFLLHFKDH